MATRVGIGPDALDDPFDLVDSLAFPAGPRHPLLAVDGTEVAVLISPGIPDVDVVVDQVLDVGATLEEPEHLNGQALEVDLLGGNQRESGLQVEAHLMAKHGSCTRPGTIGFLESIVPYVAKEIEILLHGAVWRTGKDRAGRNVCIRTGIDGLLNWPPHSQPIR